MEQTAGAKDGSKAKQNNAERLELLYRLTQTFNSSLNLDQVLNRVIDEVIAATRAERGFLMLYDENNHLNFQVARGLDRSEIQQPEFQVSRGVLQRVAVEGKPLLTSNAQAEQDLASRQSVIFLGLRSVLCVPLIFKDRVLGVIYVDNRVQTGIFTPSDQDLLSSIAASAVAAIENARLYMGLQAERARYEQLIDLSPDGILLLDQKGRILLSNSAMRTMLQIDNPAEISGRYFDSFLCSDDLESWDACLEAAAATPSRVVNLEVSLLRKTGSPNPADLNAKYLKLEGQENLQVVVRDMAEKKKMQDTLLASQRLADLGTLAAGVTHDIKSPLMVIGGTSEALLNRISEGSLEEEYLHKSLDRIRRNAGQIENIMRSMLLYARQSDSDLLPYNLSDIVRNTLLLMDHQFKRWQDIVLTTELADNLPPLCCNQSKIAQALLNLLLNARDAMPNGGEITIRTGIGRQPDELCLAVSDSGQGIPPEIQTKIFQRFFTTKPPGKGTGLGLANVASIVQELKGFVTFESVPKHGTTFYLYLPAAEDDPVPANE